MRTLLCNATVYIAGKPEKCDILVSQGQIIAIAPDLSESEYDKAFDCRSYFIFPGFVDVHTHLREPGFSYKETISTASMAAARGGFTAIGAMPNLSPVPDCKESLAIELALIAAQAKINVYPYGAITRGEAGAELSDMEQMAPDVLAFSDDGVWVTDPLIAESAMRECARLGKIYASHCEDMVLRAGGVINLGTYSRTHNLPGISNESEWRAIKRDIELAEKTGVKYHVCHVSTKESVDLIRSAKARGVDISAETAPHYLVFCDSMLSDSGSFKMNPPLRSEADRAALIEAVRDGTIDMLASDHAPHSEQEKSRGLRDSSMGVVGLETAFAAVYTVLVKSGRITLSRLVELMNAAPRARFGIGGEIKIGCPADLCVFDLNRSFTVEPERFLSMGKSTPFAGMELYGVCVLSMSAGNIVYQEESLTI